LIQTPDVRLFAAGSRIWPQGWRNYGLYAWHDTSLDGLLRIGNSVQGPVFVAGCGAAASFTQKIRWVTALNVARSVRVLRL